ncbi:hypothetical protein NJB1907Z4_C12600 [Mycobacterium pseudoshottsii]|uniref:PPE domain-containing protein n=1 Tax=Mycobacterium pseudoshottsii TaxID=265949 RepID=A0A9N7LKD2_9MYCO|nr:hypothetical protein NJB1907Z4_C12600 [Mycobacterium pseudoshottsii]
MLDAAAAWEGLASELGTAASSFSSVTSGLVSDAWHGAAKAAMNAVATPYAQLLSAASTQAAGAVSQAKAVAGAFEVARAAMIHPLEVLANRNVFVQLIRTNLFGLNAPAIMAAEGQYEQMWAQDVAAMVGYHGGASSAAASLPSGLQQILQSLPNLGLGNKGNANLGSGNTGIGNIGVGNSGEGNSALVPPQSGNYNIGGGNNGNNNLGAGNIGNFNFGFGNNGTGNFGFGNAGPADLSNPNLFTFHVTPGENNIGIGNTGNGNFGLGNTGDGNIGGGNTGIGNIGFGLNGNNLVSVGAGLRRC